MRRYTLIATAALACAACKSSSSGSADPASSAATPEEAQSFVKSVDTALRDLWVTQETAMWVNQTDITEAHEAAETAATTKTMAYVGKTIKDARRFGGVEADDATKRQLHLLKIATRLPAPDDDAKREELAGIATKLSSMYGKGKYCKEDGSCRDLGELTTLLAESRDYDALLDAWQGWRGISPPMRPMYQRFVELGNAGAKDIGFADLGELWRAGYDMSPAEFEATMERLWQQVKPLYEQLHCHVRAKLTAHYGADKVPADGPIPAHLLGNMWAQEWGNLYPMLEPHPGQQSVDVTKALRDNGYDAVKMVKSAEAFFVSLGLDPLPKTFWERSMFTKPEGRDVVCHASAWDPGYNDDLRIKMCIKTTGEDFVVIHHELGHNYYYHYYYQLPVLFQQGAHDGFHEGIGDTLALSVTPQYLKTIGLIDEVSSDDKALLNGQMQDGLEKIAFLPFGLLVDRWRWKVFSGDVAPADYNAAWWQLREQYQGIRPAVARSENDFDPGAKYHIPANTPYSRYFLAAVLQFQFHQALCQASGHSGPLHTCSIYGSKAAGEKLRAMLALGASRPWPEALEAIAGTREMDASALLDYFQPLAGYLAKQNEGRTCGW